MIKIRDDVVFEDPQLRIREYCAIEIYHGYDDEHAINNNISQRDIKAANELYAMIDRYDKEESKRLLSRSKSITGLLARIPNTDLSAISDRDWHRLKSEIENLLAEFLLIKGFSLAKATKILHLKRPNLFPVLDSYVVKFLLGINISDVEKKRLLDIGLQALEQARETIVKQKDEFEKLIKQTHDLPNPLTQVRMFDILCWTTEKWDIRKKLTAPYGKPHKSLLNIRKTRRKNISRKLSKTTIEDREKKYVVNVDFPTKSRVHLNPLYFGDMWCRLDEEKMRKDGGKVNVITEQARRYLTGEETLIFNGRPVTNLVRCKNCSERGRQRVYWDL